MMVRQMHQLWQTGKTGRSSSPPFGRMLPC